MTDYRVLLFIVVSAVGGIALAVWMLKRFGLHLLGAFVSAIIAFVITALGYWLGIGLAFTYLDVAPGNVAPWWADWVVGALFALGLAAAAFGVTTVGLGIWTAATARRARNRGDADPTREQVHRADAVG